MPYMKEITEDDLKKYFKMLRKKIVKARKDNRVVSIQHDNKISEYFQTFGDFSVSKDLSDIMETKITIAIKAK